MASLEGVKVGDTLIMFGSNMRGRREEVTVTKVGRKLLYIERYGRLYPFRIETGVANDNYGHEWLRTPAQVAELDRRDATLKRLHELGLKPVEFGRAPSINTEKLEAVVSILT